MHFFNISTSKSAPRPSVFNTIYFQICFAPRRTPCTFSSYQLPKLLRTPQFLTQFTSKSASRHNAVRFFNISTSTSAPNPSVFNTFYFQICFAPQRRALFQHLNFHKWSDGEVFCTFSLRNRLRATTASNFSSLISPDVSAPAAFSEPTFQPSGATQPRKNTVFRYFPTFSRTCIFFLLTLSLLLFSLLIFLFSLPLPLLTALLFWLFLPFLFWLFSLLTAFSSLHIVGSLTSKFPSMIFFKNMIL